jgi:very-short-patch-repair endonuclease
VKRLEEGGERRLNVLFTRARYKTEVFASFAPGDIDLSRTQSAGARILKRFLQYAESGHLPQPVVLNEDPDSDFEISVASAIRKLGYEVDYQIGSAGYRIDLAVRDPARSGRYMLAVECDGATYHSALWARERDRQRQEVLESLGWRFHRVWSTDWFYRRDDENKRLETALLAAQQSYADSDEAPVETLEIETLEPETEAVPELLDSGLPEYIVAQFPVAHHLEPHEVPLSTLSEIVERIIEIEGPVHQEEIARRVAGLFNKQKAGSRILNRAVEALKYLKTRRDDLVVSQHFWFTGEQQSKPPLRNRSRALPNLRKASMLPPPEIEAAILAVISQNGAIEIPDIPRAVALHFGFQRTGPEFRPAIEPSIEALLARNLIVSGPVGVSLP